tara:strand:+ start:195 stop:455 length:261 start_codon:yes stop_codon:yes gene_type:complete
MVRFHENLDRIQDHIINLNYFIKNPNAPYVEWVEDIINELDSIEYGKNLMTTKLGRISDPEKLEEELHKFYGDDSDGTYDDFTIPN